ncbi:hypothetical protein [Bacillus sp. 2205SS5-2]|uniref:hypothetical protein n=1 Tax=Bacillus sp. 2205SS5-2 TaxID=3109031 RepID=UPI003005E923
MKEVIALSLKDSKNILRDPILLIAIFVPIITAISASTGLPYLQEWLFTQFSWDLSPYYLYILALLLLMTPLMMGTIMGFMLLEERDENLLLFYAVTPLQKRGYLLYRIMSPMILTLLLTLIVLKIQSFVSFSWPSALMTAVLLALQSVLFTLGMATLSASKVEGLAVSKMMNLLLFASLPSLLFEGKWTQFFALFPTYWPPTVFIEGNPWDFLISLIIHIIWIVLFLNGFNKKNE